MQRHEQREAGIVHGWVLERDRERERINSRVVSSLLEILQRSTVS